MTHRQRVGLLVIGLAVVLVVVVTGLRPHPVSGAGQAAPVSGAPVVGDCVADSVPGRQLVQATVTATSGGTVPVYPAQQTRPCTGLRYGEVTSVIAAPKPTVVKGDDATYRYLDDPNLDSCVQSAMQYVGMTRQPIHRFWQTYLQIDVVLFGPSPRQSAAGQRWVACIVTLPRPQPASTSATRGPSPPRYGGSIRDAQHTGARRDQLGTCIAALDWNGDFAVGQCGQPHALEILAYGDSGNRPVSRVQVQQTCQQTVRQLTAIPDPTAAGALSIQIHIDDNSSVITAAEVPAHSNLQCGVTTTGTRTLRGSLLALGRQPIPWA